MYKKMTVTRSWVKEVKLERVNMKGRGKVSNGKKSNTTEQTYYYNQRRKQANVIDLIDVNFDNNRCSFITLTTSEKIDIKEAKKLFSKFKRSARLSYDNFKYIATVEQQNRGAFHFHVICNIADQNDLLDFVHNYWTYGTVDILLVENKIGLSLYMTKEFLKQDKNSILFCDRCYMISQNLEKPIVVSSTMVYPEEYDKFLSDSTEILIQRKNTLNRHSGKVIYSKYLLRKDIEKDLFRDYVIASKKR